MEHRLFDAATRVHKYTWSLYELGRKVGVGDTAFDTLLGPEGSGESSFLKAGIRSGPPPSRTIMCLWACGRREVWCGGRPYVENYTVDASIFVAQVFKLSLIHISEPRDS